MNTRSLAPGDPIEAQVKGVRFTAYFLRRPLTGEVEVDPVPKWATWRRLRSNQILRKVERQGKLGVGA